MWSYYGSKTTLVDLYPAPIYDTIIEPFAGAAKYSLKYFEKEVILIDKYPVIIEIWEWLKNCSVNDILSLPKYLPLGQSIDSINFDCDAARNFYGFMIACADSRPRKTAGKRKAIDRPNFTNYGLKRVAENLFKIKHWTFICGDYTLCPKKLATKFIDAPYEYGGEAYVFSNRKIDYKYLRDWCRNEPGQVIVCENIKADWLPFVPISKNRGSLFSTTEAIWTNYHTHYNNIQQKLTL